jgi:hypothetical protein
VARYRIAEGEVIFKSLVLSDLIPVLRRFPAGESRLVPKAMRGGQYCPPRERYIQA